MLDTECKKTVDWRKLSRPAREGLRRTAVKGVKAGGDPGFAASGLGVNRRSIYKWLEQYHDGGRDALKTQPIRDATPKLNAKQVEMPAHIVHAKNPQQMRFEGALWAPGLTRELNRRE